MRNMKMMAVLLPLMAGGCVRSAMDLAALPARSVDKVVDWSTTSREEAYRNGRRDEERAFERRARWDAHDVPDHRRVYFEPRPSEWTEHP